MTLAVIEKIKNKIFTGHERSVRAKKNIIALFVLKGYSILINLALIPITLHLLDDYKYGVWIMLFNVISWISIFDIGIGNGLRNKFTEAMAKGQIQLAKEYVSTGYVILSGISLGLVIIFILPWALVNWANVFNVEATMATEVGLLVGISFLLACAQFALKLIGTILTADHKPAHSGFLTAIANTLILGIFIVAGTALKDNLVLIGTIFSAIPILVFFGASLFFFAGSYHSIRPELKDFKTQHVKSLFNLGVQFFIIQIAVIVIFQTDSLIIAHMFSPDAVTPYNIAFRYFGVIIMLFGILMAPLWSAYTEAAAKHDYEWIKLSLKKQLKIFLLVCLGVVVLWIFARPIINIWMQKEIVFTNGLLLGMALYAVLSVWNNIFSSLLGGLSIIRLGTFVTTITALLNIPLSIYFVKHFGNDPGGVIYATSICIGITAIISPIQVYYFVYSNKKTKLLNKILS